MVRRVAAGRDGDRHGADHHVVHRGLPPRCSSPRWRSSTPTTSRSFSWHWFSPSVFHSHGSSGFVAGALLAAFYYWGWDVTANLNEETKNAAQDLWGSAGSSGPSSSSLLFEVFTVATNLVLTPAQMQNSNNAADIL